MLEKPGENPATLYCIEVIKVEQAERKVKHAVLLCLRRRRPSRSKLPMYISEPSNSTEFVNVVAESLEINSMRK